MNKRFPKRGKTWEEGGKGKKGTRLRIESTKRVDNRNSTCWRNDDEDGGDDGDDSKDNDDRPKIRKQTAKQVGMSIFIKIMMMMTIMISKRRF